MSRTIDKVYLRKLESNAHEVRERATAARFQVEEVDPRILQVEINQWKTTWGYLADSDPLGLPAESSQW